MVSLFKGSDIFIHLACISNDPSFELNPTLGKSINLDSFQPFVSSCVKNKVKQFFWYLVEKKYMFTCVDVRTHAGAQVGGTRTGRGRGTTGRITQPTSKAAGLGRYTRVPRQPTAAIERL